MSELEGTINKFVRELSSHPSIAAMLDKHRPRQQLAEQLISMRLRARLTQRNVAEIMGEDESYVSQMESPLGPFPDPHSIAKYSDACNVNVRVALVFVEVDDDDYDSIVRESIQSIPYGNDSQEEIQQAIEAAISRNRDKS